MGHITPGGHVTPNLFKETRSRPTMVESKVVDLGKVTFPSFEGERVYMQEFSSDRPLPSHLQRWQATVDAMLAKIKTSWPMYLMIDQSLVHGGSSHRRAGAHVDGNWVPKGRDCGTRCYPETLLLASDVDGCVAWAGKYQEELIGEGGDCSEVPLSGMKKLKLQANRCYAGNLYMIHESVPIATTCKRTLVRINVPHHNFDSLT